MTAEVPLKIYQKYTSEEVLLGFDFARFAAPGVTIVGTPTVTMTKQVDVPGSNDSDITAAPAPPPTVGLLETVKFSVGGIPGERYLAAVKANLSDGQEPREIRIFIYIKKV